MACPHGKRGPAAGSRSLQSLSLLLTATTVRNGQREPPVSIKTRQLGMGEEQSLVPPQQHFTCCTVWGQGTTRDAPSKVCSRPCLHPICSGAKRGVILSPVSRPGLVASSCCNFQVFDLMRTSFGCDHSSFLMHLKLLARSHVSHRSFL